MQRRVLVIGSQCTAMEPLSFLPDLATELYTVLTDPHLGACQPALRDGALLHDPGRERVLDALEAAFDQADKDGAMLLVALLGHGVAHDDDFYYLSKDSPGRGRSRADVNLSQHLKELLRDSSDLDGLLVLIDTCHAGVAAQQAAARWGEVGLGRRVRRYELLTASANEPAFGGDFTRTLIDVLRSGVPTTTSRTIDARHLREPLQEGAQSQHPQRVTVDGGGWAQRGDEGLWLAYNAAQRRAYEATASSAALDRARELTAHLQLTRTLEKVVADSQDYRCVVVTGPRGSGKSTLAAALIRAAAGRGRVPGAPAQAIAFCDQGTTSANLATTLAEQLTGTVPGFALAAQDYLANLDSAEQRDLSPLHRRVVGPVSQLQLDDPVRLVIDAVDELPDVTQEEVRATVTAACAHGSPAGSSGTASLAFVLTARPGAARPAGAHVVPVHQPRDQVVTAYMRQIGVADAHIPLLVAKAAGSWLHAHLLAEQAVRPGFDPLQLPEAAPELTAIYEAELLRAGADDPELWQTQLRPVLAVLTVAPARPILSLPPAGAGPTVPLPLAVAASARLGGPGTATKLRDAVVRLSGLIVRSHPGEPDERLGLLHISLAEDYLLQPESRFQIDPIEARAALAEPAGAYLRKDLGSLREHLYIVLQDIEHNIQLFRATSSGGISIARLSTNISRDLSIVRNSMEQLIDDLPGVIDESPTKSRGLVFSLTIAANDLREEIDVFAMLARRFRDTELRGSLRQVANDVRVLQEMSRVIQGKIQRYISDVQLVVGMSSQ